MLENPLARSRASAPCVRDQQGARKKDHADAPETKKPRAKAPRASGEKKRMREEGRSEKKRERKKRSVTYSHSPSALREREPFLSLPLSFPPSLLRCCCCCSLFTHDNNNTMGEDLKQLARRRVLVRSKRSERRKKRKRQKMGVDGFLDGHGFPRSPLAVPCCLLLCSSSSFLLPHSKPRNDALRPQMIKNKSPGGHPRLRQAVSLPIVTVIIDPDDCDDREQLGRRRRRRGLSPRRALLRAGPRRGHDADRVRGHQRLGGARLRRGA
jgi:hypothetical protein